MKACAKGVHLQVCIFDLMMKVTIIGTGNVAWHLAKAFATANQVMVMQVAGRNLKDLKRFSKFAQQTVTVENLVPEQVNIIAVSDDAIMTILERLPFADALVVHTSGYTQMLLGDRIRNRRGVFYPLQSFSKKDVHLDFSEIPILVEAEDPKDTETLQLLAKTISNQVIEIDSEQRRELHLAAVFANNFTNHLYLVAQEICQKSEVPFSLLHALIKKTASKAIANGPKKSQTGPAKRGDKKVMHTQLQALKDPKHKDIYTTMTKAIQATYGKEL